MLITNMNKVYININNVICICASKYETANKP